MNRNFGFHWDEGGSGDRSCQGNFNGNFPFSAIETQIVRDAISSVASQSVVYLTFHSYGQYWLTPWGYTADLPDDYDQMVRSNLTQNLRIFNVTFENVTFVIVRISGRGSGSFDSRLWN